MKGVRPAPLQRLSKAERVGRVAVDGFSNKVRHRGLGALDLLLVRGEPLLLPRVLVVLDSVDSVHWALSINVRVGF